MAIFAYGGIVLVTDAQWNAVSLTAFEDVYCAHNIHFFHGVRYEGIEDFKLGVQELGYKVKVVNLQSMEQKALVSLCNKLLRI